MTRAGSPSVDNKPLENFGGNGAALSRVSVIVPARNEEANIGECLQTLLQGGAAEILVADDGSTDRTAAIVREIAATEPRVRLIAVPPLPEGWIGKNHALHVAAPQAVGEWLLFTDADTRHAAGGLRVALKQAEEAKLDLVSYSPPQRTETWWETAVIPQVYQLLARIYPFERVNDPADPLAAANGQFILIRRDAYFRLGGHEAVQAETLEDVALARLAKQGHDRIWFGPGDGIVETRMYRRFSEMWQGWTKNLFLLLGRNRRAVRKTAAALALRYWLPPLAGAFLILAGFLWAGAALLAYAAAEHICYARRLQRPKGFQTMLLLAPGAFLLFLLLLNSERRYSRKTGVEWKGRRYSTGNL
jgi:glycosyltransferase involved in cell wall biosynthesis